MRAHKHTHRGPQALTFIGVARRCAERSTLIHRDVSFSTNMK